MENESIEKWQRADEEVRKNLPQGVKLVRTLRGHSGPIGRIAWSPDGRILASPSFDKTIRLWDAETGECLHTLKGHKGSLICVAFDPSGRTLASGSFVNTEEILVKSSFFPRLKEILVKSSFFPMLKRNDKNHSNETFARGPTIILWDLTNGELLRTLKDQEGSVNSVAFDPASCTLASVGEDNKVKLWEPHGEKLLSTLEGHREDVHCVAFDPAGRALASGSMDKTIKLWDPANGKLLHTLEGHNGAVHGVAFDPASGVLASGSADNTVKLWHPNGGKLLRTLEGHTDVVVCVAFNRDGQLIGSRGSLNDGAIRLWDSKNGVCVAKISEPTGRYLVTGLAFHPSLPLLATVGSDPGAPEEFCDDVIHIFELDIPFLLAQAAEPSAHYVNAKVVLVGDTGVGKSGLSLVLNKESYKETDSTAGRHVWTFDSQKVELGDNITQTRETLLWDLAGQPGYRVIHQLHLNEVAVALVVFDARSEIDPLAGVRHWERALRLAQQRQGTSGVPMKKFLVSARNDRGGVPISEERIKAILEEYGFDGYFKTSAAEGWQIEELRAAIEKAIDWEDLPEVTSSQLFADIKSYLLEVKKTGRLLAPVKELYDEFARLHPGTAGKTENLRAQFDTCIGRLENRDLIRRLTFGGYVLLQPELLDAYASAMVNTAREEPDGLGSLAEETALTGKFYVPKEQKVADPGQEQLLLHATVEELLSPDLALREDAHEGRYLVFPSQFNRDYEDAPEPKGKAVAIAFEGPVQSLYSTLAVRLGHSGQFTTGRMEMWRNAAVFTAKAGGKCGLYLHEFAEARGRLILFYDEDSSQETRFHFEEFVMAHSQRRALDGTVDLVRFFVCPECGDPVPDSYVKRLRAKGITEFGCPCGTAVSLIPPEERIHFRSEVVAMEKSADHQRDFDAFVMSAKGEISTEDFREWAGGELAMLAIVFTDMVGSTAQGEKIGLESMKEIRHAHFEQSRKLIEQFNGREIKTIGDSFMAAFKSMDLALDYARELHKNTGHPNVSIRAGIHVGPMTVEKDDVFGGTVNFASRVIGAIKRGQIWLSDRAKEDIESMLGTECCKRFKWRRHPGIVMKGFRGKFTLWSMHEDG